MLHERGKINKISIVLYLYTLIKYEYFNVSFARKIKCEMIDTDDREMSECPFPSSKMRNGAK